ncbi:MAG: DUF1834 family protein [Bryobacterales bacterium]|nr:DUF1834 family protein [Bryobacterales bacterium]
MSTQALLAAIVADLRRQLPALKSCEIHDGRWNADELKRWAVGAPAILVAWTGTPRTETPGVRWTDADQQLIAVVATRDTPSLPRGEGARNLVDWLLLYLPRARWGLAGVGAAERVRAENLFSAALDKTGVAMWAVTWTQPLRLEAADGGTVPPLPTELYSSAQDDPHEAIYPEQT